MTTIHVNGPIIDNGDKWVYEWFEADATCPNDVIKALPEDGSDVNVIINSGGGYVNCGNEIYTALKSYPGNVAVVVIEACSAASVIAMAGKTVRITPVGQIMIHNVASVAGGDYHVMDKASNRLQKANQSIVNAYQIKTGLPKEELLELMDKETWMTAEEAKQMGFVDEILFQDENENSFVASGVDLLPESIIQKMQHYAQTEKLEKGNRNQLMEPEAVQKAVEQLVSKALQSQQAELNHGNQKEPENIYSRFFF